MPPRGRTHIGRLLRQELGWAMACAHTRKGVPVEEAVAADLKEMESKYKQEFERLKQSPCYMNPEHKSVLPPPPAPVPLTH